MGLFGSVKEFLADLKNERAATRLDESYFDSWVETAVECYRTGVYTRIAEFIDLSSGETHVDVACGNGVLIDRMRELSPNGAIIGIDRNKRMLDVAASVIAGREGASDVYYRRKVRNNGEGLVSEFLPAKRLLRDPSVELSDGNTILIGDDIRKMDVLKRLLGKRKIDSASFVFPGVSLSGENGWRKVESHRDAAQTIERIKRETVTKAYENIFEILKPGGRLVVCEPVLVIGLNPENVIQSVVSGIRETMGDAARFFEPERGMFVSLPAGMTNSHSLSWRAEELSLRGADLTGAVLRMRRNEI